jgi:hypothetical protein
LKWTGSDSIKGIGALSMPKIVLIGGAAACALAIMVGISYWSGSNPQEFVPSPNVPSASGVDSGTVTTDHVPPQSSGDPAEDPETDPDPVIAPNETNNSDPANFIHFTDDNFRLLSSDPDRFANSTITITGRVYELVDQSSGALTLITYRINNQAIESDESRAAVMFQELRRTGTTAADIIVDDCMAIQGKVRGGIGDTNALGQPIRIPIIDSAMVTEMECVDSSMPALTTVTSDLSQSYAGVVLTVERVQLAEGHLRIKIIAQNAEAGDGVFVREKESTAEYGGVLHKSLNHLQLFGPFKLASHMPAESTHTGYLFFEPVQNYSGGPIVFKIVVEKVGISESEKSTFILRV